MSSRRRHRRTWSRADRAAAAERRRWRPPPPVVRVFRCDGMARHGRAAQREAGMEPLAIHDCRHTYASLMIAAGVNAKALSEFMGHGTIAITLDLYGHLMPGAHGEAAELLDAFLAREVGGEEVEPTAPRTAPHTPQTR